MNIHQTVDALRDIDTVINCGLLSDEEKTKLVSQIRQHVPDHEMFPHALLVHTAITRKLGELNGGGKRDGREAKEQGRTTEGVEDKAEVVAERTEEAKGKTEGVEEQAKDATRVHTGKSKRKR